MTVFRFILWLSFICLCYGYSQQLFASDFRAPDPPGAILAEYQASYVQHKWDATGISHIGAGTIYASLAVGRLRMDVMYEGAIASSLFDYAKANPDGSIPNYMYTLSPTTASSGSCTYYNVTPAYPLFPPNILTTSQATFNGLVTDDLFYANRGPLQTWSLIFGSSTSVKIYLINNTMVRMDFASPNYGTYATTRLFNIVPGTPDPKYMAHPCPTEAPTPTTSGASRR